MDRAKVQQIIEDSGAETTEMFMDAFANQTHGRILDTLIYMYGKEDDEKNLCQNAREVKDAVHWIEAFGDPYPRV